MDIPLKNMISRSAVHRTELYAHAAGALEEFDLVGLIVVVDRRKVIDSSVPLRRFPRQVTDVR